MICLHLRLPHTPGHDARNTEDGDGDGGGDGMASEAERVVVGVGRGVGGRTTTHARV